MSLLVISEGFVMLIAGHRPPGSTQSEYFHTLAVHLCYLTFEASVSKQGYRQNIFFESDATLGNRDRDEDSDNDRDGDDDGGDQAVNFEW